jgi:nitroreductase
MKMSIDMLEIIKKRRSIRKFTEEGVSPKCLGEILKAGLLAPSSKNKKPVEFIVIEDEETIKRLKDCKSFGTSGLDTAPMVIAVIADSERSDVWVEDASIAVIMMQLEAESLSLGSVWIQIRNRECTNGDSEAAVRQVLGIPGKFGVLCLLALGHKAEEREPYEEKDADPLRVHTEVY